MFIVAFKIKNSKDSRDFSKTKKGFGIFALAIALFMTHYGGGFILGGAELGYKYGWNGLIYSFSAGLGVILLGVLFSKRIFQENKKNDLETISQLLTYKFNDKKLSSLAAWLSIIALVGIASAQLFAAYKIFSLLNLSPQIYTLLITILIAFFSIKGIKALAISGKYNLIIASLGALAACFIAFNIQSEIIQPQVQSFNLIPLIAILIPTVLYTLIGQDFHQKIYASKNQKITLIATLIAGIFLILMGIFPVFIGIKSAELFLINASEAMPSFIMNTIPSLFKGLFIAAILAAVIGSAQSVINAASTQLSKDIILKKWQLTSKRMLLVESLLSIILILIAFFITLISSSIINNIILAYTLYTAGMFLPITLALFLKNTFLIKKHVFSSAIIGIVVAIILELNLIKTSIPSVVFGIFFAGVYLFLMYLINKYSFYRSNKIVRFIYLFGL
jgi:SSS family solute:Na+ symporter